MRVPVEPEVATTRASPGSTPRPSGSRVPFAVGTDHRGGPKGREQGGGGRGRQAGVERAAASPASQTRPEGVDEGGAPGEVQGDELGHRPVA